jgi:plasmid stabilization system protein ParE
LTQVVYSERALDDLERIFDFLAVEDPASAQTAVDLIAETISMLERHPLIGRPAESRLHELVISRGRSGYVALYRYLDAADVMLILAMRHQREAGYPPPFEP